MGSQTDQITSDIKRCEPAQCGRLAVALVVKFFYEREARAQCYSERLPHSRWSDFDNRPNPLEQIRRVHRLRKHFKVMTAGSGAVKHTGGRGLS